MSVQVSDWFPTHDPLDYTEDFAKFIDSVNTGWRNMKKYTPFELYKKQAREWIEEDDRIENYIEKEDQEDYIAQEYTRCKQNTLYFADKYGWLKEGNAAGGQVKYKAWEAQRLILFLFDCGYNCMIGKARQIGFTTTLMLAVMKRIAFNPSYYAKYITHSQLKGEEIFRDKLKWGFGKIPAWLLRGIGSDTKTTLSIHKKNSKNKGKTEGAHSRAEVCTPAIDAINGGSPQITLIDEIGLFDIFAQMMGEGRPTLYMYNSTTGKMEMRRQFFAWGTGGEMEKGGAAFESEFKAALEAWHDRKYGYAVIPLFFDAWAREGITAEILKSEKDVAYSKTGIDKEKFKVQFHQHYPITIDDMFLRNAKTLLPIDQCNSHLSKIFSLDLKDQPQYGYFEPVFDLNQPTPELETPYRIIGAEWIPSDGIGDERTTAVVFKHPEQEYENRYWQGTDPINSETGHSKMASAIWDSYAETVPAVVFYRVRNFKECYLQCLLLGLYYSPRDGAKELIEANIGDGYVEWLDTRKHGRKIQPQSMLPLFMRSGGKWWGINNKTNTAGHIMNKLIEMLQTRVENIYIPWFFKQMKTFVEKDLSASTSHRQSRYQAADLRYDYDDVIFAIVYAYINAECNRQYYPTKVSKDYEGKKKVRRYMQDHTTNFNLRLAEFDENGKFVKFVNEN